MQSQQIKLFTGLISPTFPKQAQQMLWYEKISVWGCLCSEPDPGVPLLQMSCNSSCDVQVGQRGNFMLFHWMDQSNIHS